MARPLTQLLKREAFLWTAAAGEVFSIQKCMLMNGPTLQVLDFTAPFIINCDASGSGFGAVLHQDARSIVFYSRRWCYSMSSWWRTSAS